MHRSFEPHGWQAAVPTLATARPPATMLGEFIRSPLPKPAGPRDEVRDAAPKRHKSAPTSPAAARLPPRARSADLSSIGDAAFAAFLTEAVGGDSNEQTDSGCDEPADGDDNASSDGSLDMADHLPAWCRVATKASSPAVNLSASRSTVYTKKRRRSGDMEYLNILNASPELEAGIRSEQRWTRHFEGQLTAEEPQHGEMDHDGSFLSVQQLVDNTDASVSGYLLRQGLEQRAATDEASLLLRGGVRDHQTAQCVEELLAEEKRGTQFLDKLLQIHSAPDIFDDSRMD